MIIFIVLGSGRMMRGFATVQSVGSLSRRCFASNTKISTELENIQRFICFPVANKEWLFVKVSKASNDKRIPSNESLLFNSVLGKERSQKLVESRLYTYYEKSKHGVDRLWNYIADAPNTTLRKTVIYPPCRAIFYRSITPSEKFLTSITMATDFAPDSQIPIEVNRIILFYLFLILSRF